ncbi:MAG: glycosyltransferase family 2 protein [Phycisphaerales bacterium]|nr:glycosyltransferase family 2 protein [Phycisphaerales bacterium]
MTRGSHTRPLVAANIDLAVIPPGVRPHGLVRVEAGPDSRDAGGGLDGQAGHVFDDAPGAMRPKRVAVVVPCFNRRGDAEALLGDLSRLMCTWPGGGADLRVLLVDNASSEPLSTVSVPEGLWVEHLRLARNTGGSGGYNAGMRRVLALDEDNEEALAWRGWGESGAEYVWLVDSDARVAPGTLGALLEVMEGDESIVAAGSAICDPITGQAFELGGHVNRRIGRFEPMASGRAGVGEVVEADYVAACCALVRADAIRDTGVFPDRFLNGDDVEWFIRMKAMTGERVVGVPWSVAMHPRFDRFPTWPRYYMTRNAFGPIDAVLGGRRAAWVRFIRAVCEVPRAVQQDMMGRRDLAKLHMAGLRHAARNRTIGPAPEGLIDVEPARPLEDLSKVLLELLGMGRSRPTTGRILANLGLSESQRREVDANLMRAGVVVKRKRDGARPVGLVRAMWGAVRRFVRGPEVDVAVVPARGRPDCWFLARVMVQVTPNGFVLKHTPRMRTAMRAMGTLLAGVWHAARVARRPEEPLEPQRSGLVGTGLGVGAGLEDARVEAAAGPSLSAVVLSYNRADALERTLRSLRGSGLFAVDEGSAGAPYGVVVVDNASSDGSAERVRERFERVRVIGLEENLGVEAFNRAVAEVESEVVLILDDDATPDARALRRAMRLLGRRPELGAVALHPRHPDGGASEWPGAATVQGRTTDRWPIMGCGNLVRREAWVRAGGYEKGFFLYRNDTDLALKLLGLGYGVHFNPAWVVWHDSPAGAKGRKSERWHRLATRNWVWMARRHGRGMARVAGAMLGWVWAHRLAGLSAKRQWATAKGAWEGLVEPAPSAGNGSASPAAWRGLLKLLTDR